MRETLTSDGLNQTRCRARPPVLTTPEGVLGLGAIENTTSCCSERARQVRRTIRGGRKEQSASSDLAGDDAHFRAAEASAAVADLLGPDGDALRRRQLLHGQANAAAVQVQAHKVLVACKPATTTMRSAQKKEIEQEALTREGDVELLGLTALGTRPVGPANTSPPRVRRQPHQVEQQNGGNTHELLPSRRCCGGCAALTLFDEMLASEPTSSPMLSSLPGAPAPIERGQPMISEEKLASAQLAPAADLIETAFFLGTSFSVLGAVDELAAVEAPAAGGASSSLDKATAKVSNTLGVVPVAHLSLS